MRTIVHNIPDNVLIPLTFDYAENILLLSLERQPAKLNFVTGLKFDILGVALSNLTKAFLFDRREGHCINRKLMARFCPRFLSP